MVGLLLLSGDIVAGAFSLQTWQTLVAPGSGIGILELCYAAFRWWKNSVEVLQSILGDYDKYFESIFRGVDVSFIQEVNGNAWELQHLLGFLDLDFRVFQSGGPDRGTGGALTIVPRSAFEGASISPMVLAPGRFLRLHVEHGGKHMMLYSLHNFGLSEFRNPAEKIFKGDLGLARANPTSSSAWHGGDFNFLNVGETPWSLFLVLLLFARMTTSVLLASLLFGICKDPSKKFSNR